MTAAEAFSLAVQLHQSGRLPEAVAAYRQALALKPDFATAHSNLGRALSDLGQLTEALAACRRALALDPNLAEAHNHLGYTLGKMGLPDEAMAAFRAALALKPNFAEAICNVGVVLARFGRLEEAVGAFRQVLQLNPGQAEATGNLGTALMDLGKLDEALTAFWEALRTRPETPMFYYNAGIALNQLGRKEQAVAALRRAIQLAPDDPSPQSTLLYIMNFHPACDAGSMLREARQWDDRHCKPLRHLIQPHKNSRDADRPLRIGYVSADYWDHASAFFLLPLFRHQDRREFTVYCYDQRAISDKVTQQMREQVQHWRKIVGLSDAEVAALVREDQIDILVDLKVHTADNRLMVFARKPAPVQMTWLGCPGTTGMATMDYRLTDPYLDPPGETDAFYAEKSIRLPDTFWCYDPLCNEPAVNAPPCLEKGFVTFGCLNNFSKVNDALLSLWARVLNANPSSRLLLLAPEGSARRWVLDRLGVGPERVEFVLRRPRSEYLRTYHRIDIGLDTLPCNGHTTSLDAFWMGVPVVSRIGSTVVGRAGWSQLSNLHLTELAARDDEQFVKIASELARDVDRLADLRRTLRRRMLDSPLTDGRKFTQGVESAFRQAWREWCRGNAGPAS
ncbi:MAG: tetratricopeptide repeat protein [Tepidisphaeraceae bacterium]